MLCVVAILVMGWRTGWGLGWCLLAFRLWWFRRWCSWQQCRWIRLVRLWLLIQLSRRLVWLIGLRFPLFLDWCHWLWFHCFCMWFTRQRWSPVLIPQSLRRRSWRRWGSLLLVELVKFLPNICTKYKLFFIKYLVTDFVTYLIYTKYMFLFI